jgi:cytochrome c-type biogenesis protein CcmH
MLFWVVAAVLTAVVTALVLGPLLRPSPAGGAAEEDPSRVPYDVEVYRDQLAEVDRDLARGVIEPRQAEAARAEIGRRILAAADRGASEGRPHAPAGPARTRWVAVALCCAIPLGALAVYMQSGRPDLPGLPFASREVGPSGPPPEVLTAVANLSRHLETNPDDLQGWVLLGQVYDRMGRYRDSADALRRAVGLGRGDASITGSFGEALLKAEDGRLNEEARLAFEAALAADPDDPRARYYLGLGRFQVGDWRGALDRWAELVRRSPADAPWLPLARQRIAEAAGQLGVDPASVTPEPRPAEAGVVELGRPGGPSAEDAAQAAQLTPDQRRDMVRGMVDRLAARLEAEPGDTQGWLRLARSYGVLGEHERAREALDRARAAAPDDPDVLSARAEALISARPEDAPPPPEAVEDLRKVLETRPDDARALYFLGLDAASRAEPDRAAELWGRLLRQLDPGSPIHAELRTRLDALKGG